jgi:2-methylisocitrate lyase-like PEP mutase family enzyme
MSRFESFAALHTPGKPLILFNVWDAGSAKVAERAGARAIATGSASVATAHGVDDAEGLPIALALANAERIVEEEALAANLAALATTGAIGCNFEDQVIGGEGMHAVDVQAKRIAAARRGAGTDFFLNARTDIFLQARPDTHDQAMADAAIERAHAYAEAGASGFFVPGLANLDLLARVCAASPLPVNFMAFPGAPSAQAVAETGIARISHGPFPHMLALKAFEDAAREAFVE